MLQVLSQHFKPVIDGHCSGFFPGCRHSLSGPPRLEELHPRIPVQRRRHGSDRRERLQAKQTHFIAFLSPFRHRSAIRRAALTRLTGTLTAVEASKCCRARFFIFLCVFSSCKDNRGIYSALRLDKVFNISSFLNTTVVSMHAEAIASLYSGFYLRFIFIVMMNHL